jgi:hypothetical protein
MPFWNAAGPNIPAPKRNYRWLLYLGGIPQWICKKVTKPSVSLTEAEHTYLNHKFYYPGRVEWQTIDVTLVDPVSPDAVQTLDDIIFKSGYRPPEDQNSTLTVTKGAATDALGKVIIQQLGIEQKGPGSDQVNVVEEWQLYNAWVKDVKYGELDYTSDDLTEITLTLRYDYAKLNGRNDAVLGPLTPKPQGATVAAGDEG